MKNWITLLLLVVTAGVVAQDHVNLKKGYAAEGYDVVAYFSNKALKGDKTFAAEHKGVKYKFSSAENLGAFKENPERYVPQYGGYCAYAVGIKGEKIGVNPKTFQIVDDKLYLFYNSFGVNTLEKWNAENPKVLQAEADKKWQEIVMPRN